MKNNKNLKISCKLSLLYLAILAHFLVIHYSSNADEVNNVSAFAPMATVSSASSTLSSSSALLASSALSSASSVTPSSNIAPLSLASVSHSKMTFIKNAEGKNFGVVTVSSPQDLEQVPENIGIDQRIKTENTDSELACFNGLALDPEHTRTQVYLVYDKSSCIGVATLLVTPYKNLTQDIYFKKDNNTLKALPFSKLFAMSDNTFVIEAGWMSVLPEYRGKGLGKAIFSQVLLPAFKKLYAQAPNQIVMKCSVTGHASMELEKRISEISDKYFSTGESETYITPEIANELGQIDPEAEFTKVQAMKMNMQQLSEVYNTSLGPVFATKVSSNPRVRALMELQN